MRSKYSKSEDVMKDLKDNKNLTLSERINIRVKLNSFENEKDKEVNKALVESKTLKAIIVEKDKTIADKNDIIKEKNSIIDEKNSKIKAYEERDKNRKLMVGLYVTFLIFVSVINLIGSDSAVEITKGILEFLVEIISSLFL